MRIAIDCTAAVKERAGIGRFARDLIRAVLELDDENQYLLVQPMGSPASFGVALPPNARVITLPFSSRMATVLWNRLNLPVPMELFTGPVDIFHSPDYVLPHLRHGRPLVTVHDLSFLICPSWFEPSLVRFLSKAVPRATKRSHLVLADSDNTKRDLTHYLGVPADKIKVVHGGVSQQFSPITDKGTLRKVRQKYGVQGPFLLTVSTLEPRKNLVALINAYEILHRKMGVNHPLLIAGGKGWLYEEVFRRVETLKLADQVRFLSFVPEEDLPALLSLSEVFIFPSLYEGFGLPPLEAMACGVPVVASDTPCLGEVLGDAALLVDPKDPQAIAEAVGHLVIAGKELRGQLVQKGLARASRFSWQASARSLLAVYEEAGG